MRTKATAIPHLIAKIDYMQSVDANITESGMKFLQGLRKKLLNQPANLSTKELNRIEQIFELDQTRRVFSVKATDQFFARDLSLEINNEKRSDAENLFDPFADIGKKMTRKRDRIGKQMKPPNKSW